MNSQQDSGRWMPTALALLIWLCSLPLVFLIAVPLFSWKIAMLASLALLVGLLLMCWIICIFRLKSSGDPVKQNERNLRQ